MGLVEAQFAFEKFLIHDWSNLHSLWTQGLHSMVVLVITVVFSAILFVYCLSLTWGEVYIYVIGTCIHIELSGLGIRDFQIITSSVEKLCQKLRFSKTLSLILFSCVLSDKERIS